MMEGKRFGIGLAAGILLALAIVTVSGGLVSTPQTASFGPAAASTTSTTTVAATSMATVTFTMSTTTVPPTTTSTESVTSTTNGGSGQSLNSNVTYATSSVSPSSTTGTITATSVSRATTTSSPAAQLGVANVTAGPPYNSFTSSGTTKPSQLANIAHQPIASNAEILAPILVAFLLGAFLYRVAVQDRERSSGK